MVPDGKGGRGLKKVNLSDYRSLENWAEILCTRGVIEQEKGEGLLTFVDKFMANIDMALTHESIYSQKLAIMQAAINFISGYKPSNETRQSKLCGFCIFHVY